MTGIGKHNGQHQINGAAQSFLFSADFENVVFMIFVVTLTKISISAIIIPVLRKGARFMQISVFVCADMVRLAPDTLTR